MRPYDEMRILTYGLSEADQEQLRERIPVLFGPSYARFDFSGHDGWDKLKNYRALSVICNPAPKKRLVPYAPPYIVLRGIDELRRICCPPADALVLLIKEPEDRMALFPHLEADLQKKINNRPFARAARIYEKAQTPALMRLDGRLDREVSGTFADGYVLLDFVTSGTGAKTHVLRLSARRIRNWELDGHPFETLCRPAAPISERTAEETGIRPEDLESAPSVAAALQALKEWCPDRLPILVWSADETASAFFTDAHPEHERLPGDSLILDLGSLTARLFPAHFIKEAFTPLGISKLAGAQKGDLDAMAALAVLLLNGLSLRYHMAFDHFAQLLELYRPEALDALDPKPQEAEET